MDEQTFKTFFYKVKKMRNAQRMYFKTRQKKWLVTSRNLESEVDEMINNEEQQILKFK